MYADDVQIYNSGSLNGISACVNNINSDLGKIDIWARHNGLCINPTKSKCILMDSSNRNITNDIQINISSNVIEFVSCSKNLGVIFNSKLTWSNYIASAVGKIYGMLRNLWAVKCSIPFGIRMLLAKTYLIPVLLYGCEIYANCDANDLRKLKASYNNIARYVFNLIPNLQYVL